MTCSHLQTGNKASTGCALQNGFVFNYIESANEFYVVQHFFHLLLFQITNKLRTSKVVLWPYNTRLNVSDKDVDSHMHLFVAYPQQKKLMVLDSHTSKKETTNAALKIMHLIAFFLHDEDWSFEIVKVPQQQNNDCAAFACMFAWVLIYQLPFDMTPSYVRCFRRHMTLTLLQGSLHFRLTPKVS